MDWIGLLKAAGELMSPIGSIVAGVASIIAAIKAGQAQKDAAATKVSINQMLAQRQTQEVNVYFGGAAGQGTEGEGTDVNLRRRTAGPPPGPKGTPQA